MSIGVGVPGIEAARKRASVALAVAGVDASVVAWWNEEVPEVSMRAVCGIPIGFGSMMKLLVVGEARVVSAVVVVVVEAGSMRFPVLAGVPGRLKFRMTGLPGGTGLVGDPRGLLITVADLDRLRWTKLPSKEDRSTTGPPSSSERSSSCVRVLDREDAGESPRGFSIASAAFAVVGGRTV